MRRFVASLVIIVYLATIAGFLGRHILEGSGAGPAAYFWTWDMFPHYETESVRRTILGETAEHQFVQLLPDASDRFRWGNHNDLTRIDLDRRDPSLTRVVTRAIEDDRRSHDASDPKRITRVIVAEQYWPVRFNAAKAVTEEEPASPADARRTYWRVAAEADVAPDGAVTWKPAP